MSERAENLGDPVRVVRQWASALAQLQRSFGWELHKGDDRETAWQLILDAWLLLDPAARIMLIEVMRGPPLTERCPRRGTAALRDLAWSSPAPSYADERAVLTAIGLIFEPSKNWLRLWGTEDEPFGPQLAREPDAEQRFLGALFEDGLLLTDALGSLFADEYLLVTFDQIGWIGSTPTTVLRAVKFFVSRRAQEWYVSLWPEQVGRWLHSPAGGDGLAGVREPRRPFPPGGGASLHLDG